jgi:hypothetical protein
VVSRDRVDIDADPDGTHRLKPAGFMPSPKVARLTSVQGGSRQGAEIPTAVSGSAVTL